MYLANAMEVLPRLYREKSLIPCTSQSGYGKTLNARQLLKSRCVMLLAMEQGTFTLAQLDSSSFDNLRWYSTDFEFNQRYPPPIYKNKSGFYHFCSTWAKLLLEDKKLDTNEQLICKVLTGEKKNPEGEIKRTVRNIRNSWPY